MDDMSKRRKSLSTTKDKDSSRREKPLVIKGELIRSRIS